MLKRTFFFMFFLNVVLNGSIIVGIKKDNRNLKPIFEKKFKIVAELKNYEILLIEKEELKNLQGINWVFIDELTDKNYYLVKKLDKNIDIERYGKPLLEDGDLYLLKLDEGKFFELKKEKVFIKLITFKPIVKIDKTFDRKFNYEPFIQEIVNKVNNDSVLCFVRRLQNFRSRFSTYDSSFYASLWIAQKYYEYGCDTVIFQYHTAGHAPNVIGIKYGTLYPSNYYTIISGHYDAYSNQIPTFVPGADDNASGTAGTIECARVLKDYRFEYTIKFISFSGEEFGLFGSEYYASNARSINDSIISVINADMIGYVDHEPESVDVIGKNSAPSSGPLADYFINCANNYTNLKTLKILDDNAQWSDHAPFWDYGYYAICLIEDEDVPNPYYHTIGDTIGGGYNNNTFATEVIKAEVATIASLSILSGTPNSPEEPILLSPFDCARITDTRPTFSFYSSDPQNDSILYEIMIDDNPDFASPEIIQTSKFGSDSIVRFTLTNPLDLNRVYYWKVRAKDPDGTNFWSLFSETRTFTVSDDIPSNTCSFFQSCSLQFSGNYFEGSKISGDSIILEQTGYTYDTLLFEDFENGIPSNWLITDGNNDNIKWDAGTTNYLLYFTPPSYSSKYAYYSDRSAGNNVQNTTEEIITPPIYIPSGVNNIRIIYGYGFRVNQSGENMQLKTRKFTTYWQNYIIRYTHSQTSSGNNIVELTSSNFPMESLQVKWNYTDQSSYNHYGYACAIDNVTIVSVNQYQNNSGFMITKEITFDELNALYERDKWGDIILRKSEGEDSIGIQVEYYNGSEWELIPDEIIQQNSSGIFSNSMIDTISLASVSPFQYNMIRVKTIFKRYTSKSSSEPSLISLEIGNLTRYVGIDEKDIVKEFSISRNILTSSLDINWGLSKKTNISINLFDITGRKIKEIYNGVSDKGNHRIKFEAGKNISSGIYFIHFEAENNKIIKRVILLR